MKCKIWKTKQIVLTVFWALNNTCDHKSKTFFLCPSFALYSVNKKTVFFFHTSYSTLEEKIVNKCSSQVFCNTVQHLRPALI